MLFDVINISLFPYSCSPDSLLDRALDRDLHPREVLTHHLMRGRLCPFLSNWGYSSSHLPIEDLVVLCSYR